MAQVPPFANVGMDCFGHFIVKERRSELKKWGVLFTCLYSRAIHIEIIEDLTTGAFIGTLRCFMTLRGPVSTILCDNGTNFAGAKNEFNKLYQMMDNDKMKQYLTDKQIDFKMISPTASLRKEPGKGKSEQYVQCN